MVLSTGINFISDVVGAKAKTGAFVFGISRNRNIPNRKYSSILKIRPTRLIKFIDKLHKIHNGINPIIIISISNINSNNIPNSRIFESKEERLEKYS
jgi:hypothetical protein